MRTVKRFEPVSLMKIAAICYAALGLLEGVFFSVMFAIIPPLPSGQSPFPRFFGPLMSGMAIIVFPILFAVMGALGAGVSAVIYNVVAKFVGGIQVEVE